MTTSELIETLSRLPADTEIYFEDLEQGGSFSADYIEEHIDNNDPYFDGPWIRICTQ